jgi:hypothetical protein
MTGYTYDISIYLAKDRQNTTQTMIATHVAVKSLTRRVKSVAIKCTWIIFSHLWICLMTCTQKLSSRVVELSNNHNGMLGDFDNKTLKLKWSDIHAMVIGVLTAMIWKDK